MVDQKPIANLYLWSGREFYGLKPGTHLLGRGDGSLIPLDDPLVSREHGQIKVKRGEVSYTDLRSSNGSWINSGLIDPNKAIVLCDGDWLQIGKLQLFFTWAQEVPNITRTISVPVPRAPKMRSGSRSVSKTLNDPARPHIIGTKRAPK